MIERSRVQIPAGGLGKAETLPAGTKPSALYHRAPGGEGHRKRQCSPINFERKR